MDAVLDIQSPDPATVLAISGYFAPMRHLRLDHIYVKRGVTYAITVSRGDDCAPPDATIWRYLRDTIQLEEIGRIDGMCGGSEIWYDDDAAHAVPGLRAQ